MPQTVTQSGTIKATYGWFEDGTYTIVETKLRSSTPLSTGQKRASKNVTQGNQMFEVRSDVESLGLKSDDMIKAIEYKRIDKYK